MINGDLGLHPGSAVTGFPPGTVNGAQHVSDAVALQAKSDLVTAYNDAAGRPLSATTPPDIGGRGLVAGVYRTGSAPTLELTGTLTLDAQGDPRAVFIFQVASSLVTATDSSISLVNGAQACNVFWKVGSSATLRTRTSFAGNLMALTSISLGDGVSVDGRLLARDGAVTLITDSISRAHCAAGTGGPGGPGGPGAGSGGGLPADTRGPRVRIVGLPGVRQPLIGAPRGPGAGRPPFTSVCTKRNFTASVRLRDGAGIRRVKVYIDGKLVRRTTRKRFSLRISVRGLRVGRHTMTVIALDRAGNRSVTRRHFGRCALPLAVPRLTG